MPEEDAKVFGEVYQIYDKWRGTQIRTLEQWCQLTTALWDVVARNEGSRLAVHLAAAVMAVFDDLYHDGAVPPVPDYFGRSDL